MRTSQADQSPDDLVNRPALAQDDRLERSRWHFDSSGGAGSSVDALIVGLAGLLLIAVLPGLDQGIVHPRVALLALAVGPGLLMLTRLVRDGERAARWAGAFLAWSLISALLASDRRTAFYAGFGTDRGWVFLMAFWACWALGRRLELRGRRWLPLVLLGGAALSALVAVAQLAFDLGGVMATASDRAKGLTPDAVYLGGVMAGGLAMAGALAARARTRLLLVLLGLVALLAAADNLSGSRVAIVGGLAVAVLSVWRGGVRRVALVAAALGIGLLLSSGMSSASGGQRVAGEGGAGIAPRATMWGAGLRAVAHRPLTGFGPGGFEPATSSRTTQAFARAEGPDKLFFDAHNLAVEQLVSGGVVGLALLGGFIWSTARQARGPLAWFSAGVAVTWLLEPAAISTAPLVLLALGAAGPSRPPAESVRAGSNGVGEGHRPRRPTWGLALAAMMMVVGLGAGSCLLVADRNVVTAKRTGDRQSLERARRLMPPDAVLSDLETQADINVAPYVPPAGDQAQLEARRTIDLQPWRAIWWVRLGYAEAARPVSRTVRLDRAEAAFRQALRRNPWSSAAFEGLRQVAAARGDRVAEARWRSRLRGVGVTGADIVGG